MKNTDESTDTQVTHNTDLNKKPDDKSTQGNAKQKVAQNNPQWEPTDKQSQGKGYEEEGF